VSSALPRPRDIVDSGRVTPPRHNSRLHHIGLGNAHNATRVLILVADLHVRVITLDGRLPRELPARPHPRLPTLRPQTRPRNNVARHVFTMSRDITWSRDGESNPGPAHYE